MRIFLLLIALIGFSFDALADCCICEIDTNRKDEMSYYRTGCSIWLNRVNIGGRCRHQEVREMAPVGKELRIPNACKGQTIQLGYVGHWSSARSTAGLVKQTLLPAMLKNGSSIEYDNTACRATDDSDYLQKFIEEEVRPQMRGNQYLKIKGNQVNSIGIWDAVFGTSNNLYSIIDTRKNAVHYPSCSDFEDRACFERGTFLYFSQLGEKGYCRDGKHLYQLTCQYSHYISHSNNLETVDNRATTMTNLWKRGKSKYEIDRAKKAALDAEKREKEAWDALLQRYGFVNEYSRKHLVAADPSDNALRTKDGCELSGGEGATFKNRTCFVSIADSVSLYKFEKNRASVFITLYSGSDASSDPLSLSFIGTFEAPGVLSLVSDSEGCKGSLELAKEGQEGGAVLQVSGKGCREEFSLKGKVNLSGFKATNP